MVITDMAMQKGFSELSPYKWTGCGNLMRRGLNSISPNPHRMGQIFPFAALRLLDGTPPHLRKRTATNEKIRPRRLRSAIDDTA